MVYGSREIQPKVWRRGPRLFIEAVMPSALTGDRLLRVPSGPPEQELLVDEDVYSLPNLTVVRVFGVWGLPDPT
jgi:hypothetical protein